VKIAGAIRAYTVDGRMVKLFALDAGKFIKTIMLNIRVAI
jgi:hypothetical protein